MFGFVVVVCVWLCLASVCVCSVLFWLGVLVALLVFVVFVCLFCLFWSDCLFVSLFVFSELLIGLFHSSIVCFARFLFHCFCHVTLI